MNRRECITLLGGVAAAWPVVGRAQQPAMPVIGFLGSSSPADRTRLVTAFRQGIRETGYVEGQSVAIEYRWAQDQYDRLPDLAADLVRRQVAVIAAHDTLSAIAAKAATATIPIVFATAGDPVKDNLVGSLNRPGGNVTGISDVAAELAPKRLELLKEAAPKLLRVAMLWNANDLGMTTRYEASAAAAKKLGVTVLSFGVREPDDFGDAFEAMERDKPDGLLMVADALTFLNRKRVFDFAAEHRLPVIYETRAFARDGGLMSYGPDEDEAAERGANLVLRILKGEKPADLPLEQPTRFRLVINLKTAKALGLTVPPGLLVAADELIE